MKNYLIESSSDEPQLNSIKDVLSQMESQIKSNPKIATDVQKTLVSTVSQLYRAALNNTDGYCVKYQLPISAVNSIFRNFNLSVKDVEKAFRNDWKYPSPNTHM